MKAVFWCIKDTDEENSVFCVALEVGEIPRTDTKMSLFSQNSHDPCINLWQNFVVFFDYILGAFPFSTVNPVTSTGRPSPLKNMMMTILNAKLIRLEV